MGKSDQLSCILANSFSHFLQEGFALYFFFHSYPNCGKTAEHPVPEPPRGVLLTAQIQSGQHPHQGGRTTDHIEY
jgi:hypothetical protein